MEGITSAQLVTSVPNALGKICFQMIRLSFAPSVLAARTYS